ncbi:hypothetical protein M9Y10_003894 [Tritrichomonas musculus]|uniref:F5/8 type C domain-containing protein n=1 Tax=Tritrichomonas musculus TaxID=1915356 RepID=A0ABR2JQI3_9EUKA
MSSVKVDLTTSIQSIIKFIPPDFTIITNDKPYPCQKLLAAAQSCLIRDYITSNQTSNEIVLDLEDKKHQFNLIINLFNGQEIEIDQDNAYFLLCAASELKFHWLTNQIRHLSIQLDGTNSIDYNQSNPLNGIFSYINQFYPNTINIKTSSSTAYGVPESLIYQHISGEYWESQSIQPNPWFQINLKDKKINLVGYVLQTTSNASDSRNPNSWIVAGSNDGENWHTLSQIDKKSDLYEPNIAVAFECFEKENDDPYSMFRFEMTEPTYEGDWTFRIARVEFYGDIYGEVAEKDPLVIINPNTPEAIQKVPDESLEIKEEEIPGKSEIENEEKSSEKADNQENTEKFDQSNDINSEKEITEKVNIDQINAEKNEIENIEETDQKTIEKIDENLPDPEEGVVGIGYEEEKPLNGVLYYLKHKYPNRIEFEASSTSIGECQNLMIGTDEDYWESNSGSPNPWFQITLKNIQLDIIGYVIKSSYHSSDLGYPNSWIVAGSNDGEEWYTLDQVDNSSSLAEAGTVAAFECSEKDSNDKFSIFRFEMTEKTVDGEWSFRLSRVELFGDLYINE